MGSVTTAWSVTGLLGLAALVYGLLRLRARQLLSKHRTAQSGPAASPSGESNAAALEEGASLASARAAEALRALLDRGLDVYLLAHVASDVGEAVVRGALEAEGLLGAGPGQVSPHRLLLCGTQIGKVSVVRQLEPELHIDADAETVAELQRFIPRLALVGAGRSAPWPNVMEAGTLEDCLLLS
ncbi:hypothetical protein QBZ16_000792 [Prototheca wickerhamii]|uniref:Uncharacterized protein n=1 Tax=Prototheca wickerhamii TaxID=3111 RepID=A0AAD9INB4_PROWI|nr:hypothetical protein QBZ16_000792 [Prototheca wickerhamii]